MVRPDKTFTLPASGFIEFLKPDLKGGGAGPQTSITCQDRSKLSLKHEVMLLETVELNRSEAEEAQTTFGP